MGKKEKPPSTQSSATRNAVEYLTKAELVKELLKMAAVFPHFMGTDLTWEMYCQDLYFIPKAKLTRALETLRRTSKFFPSVSEIIQTAIGTDFRVVRWNPQRPATIADIVRAYRDQHETQQILLDARDPKRIDGPEEG